MNRRNNKFNRIIILCVLSLSIVIISTPRFNRQDRGFKKLTRGEGFEFISDKSITYSNLSTDANQYLLLVKYFRTMSEHNKMALQPPFCYRPLGPYIASFLPFDEMTSLNILNVFWLILTLLTLQTITRTLGVSNNANYASLFLFVFSFPTFYYGTIAYIDPFLILFLAIGLLIIITEKWLLFPFLILIGVFVKEGIAILLPVALLSGFIKIRSNRSALLYAIAGIIAYLVGSLITRAIFPSIEQYFWMPSLKRSLWNLSRFRTIFSISVSLGIPGLLSTLLLMKTIFNRKTTILPVYYLLFSGFFMSLVFCLFGFITVASDGRYIWPSYVFSIPLSAIYLNQTLGRGTKS